MKQKLLAAFIAAEVLTCFVCRAQITSPLNDFPPTAILWDAVKIGNEMTTLSDATTALEVKVDATNVLHMAFFNELWARTNVWNQSIINVASLSNGLVNANSNIALNSNNLVTAFAYIANNSNGIVSAESKIALTSNTVVSALAQIDTNRNNIASISNSLYSSYLSLTGGVMNSGARITIRDTIPMNGDLITRYGNRDIYYGGAGTPLVTLSLPDWAEGETQMIASREWASIYFAVASNETTAVNTRINNQNTATKELTGFDDPSAVTASYDSSARTITLTQSGGVKIWWRGSLLTLASPWTSVAHTDSVGNYYLAMRDSTNAVWSTDVWTFDMAMMAYVKYNGSDTLGFRETHGLMQWQVHEAEHRTVGTYRKSGLTPIEGTYGIQFDVNASNTPSFNAGVIKDEDNETTIAEWAQDSYTLLSFTNATQTAVFHTNQANLVLIGDTYPLINTTASTFTETVSARYINVYQILMPVTSDAKSQLYRTVFLQPQVAHTSLAAAQAEDFRSLSLGTFTSFGPEFVAFSKITFRTFASYGSTGKMRIESIAYLSGSQASQTVITQLTAIDHNSALNRDAADAHPTNSITGLSERLAITPTNNQPMSITFTNGTTMADGVLNGTNAVYFSKNGTNYWILLP